VIIFLDNKSRGLGIPQKTSEGFPDGKCITLAHLAPQLLKVFAPQLLKVFGEHSSSSSKVLADVYVNIKGLLFIAIIILLYYIIF
jgi:hypothetical protein